MYYDGTTDRGFLEDGSVFTTIDIPGAGITFAKGINDSGQIVGTRSDSRSTFGFLSVPEPSTPPMAGTAAIFGLVAYLRRRRAAA